MFAFADTAKNTALRCAWILALAIPFAGAHAAGFQALYAFHGKTDGAVPDSEVIMDAAGSLTSTTFEGGGGNCGEGQCGTVFRLAPNGTETVLYRFCALTDCADGMGPGGVIEDATGNLYGTTSFGGADDCGTVFKLAPDGAETVLYSFKGGRDGCNPISALLADSFGNLYGTTLGYYDPKTDHGTVFKVTPDGTETVLYAFQGGNDGCEPDSALIADSAGNLYSTTPECGANGYGTVFELAPDGIETVLYAFKGGADGATPIGGVIADASGNLYGTTYVGGVGAGSGGGTIFRLAPNGAKTILHKFRGGTKDGAQPLGGLTADSTGNLYGITALGGGKAPCKFDSHGNCGTVFELGANGTLSLLYVFTGGSDGGVPAASLLLSGGTLYGTAQQGGRRSKAWSAGAGTVFALAP